MGTKYLFLFTLFAGAYLCDAYKILVVFTLPGKSHSLLGNGFVRNLLKAGHEVTYITPFPWKNPPKNLTQIDCETMSMLDHDFINIETIMENRVDLKDVNFMMQMMRTFIHGSLEHPKVVQLMEDPNVHFDLAIVEWLFMDSIAGFAAAFDVPFVWFSSVDPHWMILSLIDENPSPAYTSDLQSTSIPPFSFAQRVIELWTQIVGTVFKKIILNSEIEFYEKVVGSALTKKGKTVHPLETIIYNASLVLSNSHYSLGQPMRLPQNLIPIGGYHIDTEDFKPLPADLQKLMDESKNGVIYFSMGSNLKSKDMPDQLKQSLLKMFASLPYTVLWKFEETWDDLPKNIRILKWAPQPSILAHPRCILFITHGGLLSTTETVHFGVPIIGIPVFGDQFVNVQRSVSRGFARKVDLSYTMADELKTTILEMVSNPSYREKVKALSALYHERPVKPADELVFWVEHVIKTRGAPHLRSPALHVPFYQKFYLDLAALILAVLLIVRALIKYLIRSIKGGKVNSSKKKN